MFNCISRMFHRYRAVSPIDIIEEESISVRYLVIDAVEDAEEDINGLLAIPAVKTTAFLVNSISEEIATKSKIPEAKLNDYNVHRVEPKLENFLNEQSDPSWDVETLVMVPVCRIERNLLTGVTRRAKHEALRYLNSCYICKNQN